MKHSCYLPPSEVHFLHVNAPLSGFIHFDVFAIYLLFLIFVLYHAGYAAMNFFRVFDSSVCLLALSPVLQTSR